MSFILLYLLGFTSIVSQNSFFSIGDSSGINNLSGGNSGINIEKDFYKVSSFFSFKMGFDHCDSTRIGIYDPIIGIGVNSNVMSAYLNIVPVVSLPFGRNSIKRNYTFNNFGVGLKFHYIMGFNYLFDVDFRVLNYYNNLYDILSEVGFKLNPQFIGLDIGLKYHTYLYQGENFDKLYFTPSLIYKKHKNFYISAGLDFRISKAQCFNKALDSIGVFTGREASPPWFFNISFSYIPEWRVKKKKQKLVYFHLFDKKTGKPISGLISIEGIGSIMADSTGVGDIRLFPKLYNVTILKEGYVNIDTVCDVRFKKDIFIFLDAPIHKGWVTGMITDRKSGKPLYASITIMALNKRPFYSDKLTGIYNLALSPGSYVIKVQSQGYFAFIGVIDVKDGERDIKNFYLLRKG